MIFSSTFLHLFLKTHLLSALPETSNFFMMLNSLIYLAGSLMRLTDRNGTRAFYDSPEKTVLLKKKKKRTLNSRRLCNGCVYDVLARREIVARIPSCDGYVYRRHGSSNFACIQLTFTLRDEN